MVGSLLAADGGLAALSGSECRPLSTQASGAAPAGPTCSHCRPDSLRRAGEGHRASSSLGFSSALSSDRLLQGPSPWHGALGPRRTRSSGVVRVVSRGGGRGGGPSRGASTYRPKKSPMGSRNRRQEDDGPAMDGPPINEMIRAPTVRLLAADQTMLGIVSRESAIAQARELELDLVMIAPDAEPPVAKIMDYSKYRYEQQKKKREQQKRTAATRQELKELKMRYNIDSHDYDVRLRSALKFLSAGDKVKLTLQFKGREMDFKDIAQKMMVRFQGDVAEVGIVESRPQMEGRSMTMILGPDKVALQKAQTAEAREKRRLAKAQRKAANGAAASADGEADEDDSDFDDDDDEEEAGDEDDGGEEEGEDEDEERGGAGGADLAGKPVGVAAAQVVAGKVVH